MAITVIEHSDVDITRGTQSGKCERLQGDLLRDQGKARVSTHNKSWLYWARNRAEHAIRVNGDTTTDDVREIAETCAYHPDHKNVWGCVFNDKRFKAIGYKKSTIPSNHSRKITVWALK